MLAAALIAAVTVISSANAPAIVSAAALVQGRQEAPQAREAREAMKKLAWLAGQWRGTASITQGPGGAMQLQQSEDVRFKVFDTSLLIEGTGRELSADGRPGAVVFQALAVIHYDAASKSFAMRAITERGSVDPRIEVKDREIIWGFEVPGGGGEVRYHIRLDEQGRWIETGEFTRDEGATWMKFIEMELQRQDDPAP